MERIFKNVGIALAGIAALGLVFVWSQYGEYDHRDLPSKIRITAKAKDGYHVHVKATFYPSREIPGLCVQIMGTPGSSTIKEYYNDISASGIEAVTKKRWGGICGYQLNVLFVTCTKTKSYPDFKNDSIDWAGIGILKKDDSPQDRTGFGYHSISSNPILNNAMSILVINGKNHFFGCESGCEDHGSFGIDKSNTAINISCKDGIL